MSAREQRFSIFSGEIRVDLRLRGDETWITVANDVAILPTERHAGEARVETDVLVEHLRALVERYTIRKRGRQ